ncbi:MAG: precorrin-8X methylmutase [Alphaproteobacteria bacterium]|nr:precorrin-8X methylmutase [Alphaproteobacteria bacterium]
MAIAYLKDPIEIYRQSWRLVRAATPIERIHPDLADVALRLVHATAMPDICDDLIASPGAATSGRDALARGAPVLADAEMVANGIIRSRLPSQNGVICTLNDPRTPSRAATTGITRSAAAVELWPEQLAGAIVAIGNAPTALFRLLELIEQGAPRPALVLGFCVGFVGAAESKDALAATDLPHIALRGRRGGSALAAAAVNALAGPPEGETS